MRELLFVIVRFLRLTTKAKASDATAFEQLVKDSVAMFKYDCGIIGKMPSAKSQLLNSKAEKLLEVNMRFGKDEMPLHITVWSWQLHSVGQLNLTTGISNRCTMSMNAKVQTSRL